MCAPLASLERPELQVCLFLGRGWWNAVRYTAGLLTGTLARYSDVLVVPAHTVTVAGTPGEPVQGDGDVLARLPTRVTVAAETLAVLVPAV